MALKIFSPALANPMKFVPVDHIQPASWHTPDFDATLFVNSFKEWQNSSSYAQKYQQDDQTTVQFHYNSDGPATLELIDCKGKVWRNYTPVYRTYQNNSISIEGVDYVLYSVNFTPEFIDIPDGLYSLKLTLAFDAYPAAGYEATGIYISEPVLIGNHINTVLLDYSIPDRIHFNTWFESWSFRMRVEGNLSYQQPDSVDTQYNDQNYNVRLLHSYTFRKFVLNVGGAAGVPDWVVDKLNIALGCKRLFIDGNGYTKGEGAKMTITKGDKRNWFDIEIREQDNYDTTTFIQSYFDADAQKFIDAIKAAGGIYQDAHIPHLNRLVMDLKGAVNSDYATVNVWADLLAFYPMFGNNAAAHKFNLKDPRDLDAAFRLNFVNNPTHTNGVVAWNGTSQYGNTFVRSTMLNINSAHMGYYTLTPDSTNSYLMGASMGGNHIRMVIYGGTAYYCINSNGTFGLPIYQKGHKMINRTNNSNFEVYQ